MALLAVNDLKKYFGGLHAVDGVSVQVQEGDLVGLIGPNGSGKTTLLNMLSGHLHPDSGNITLDGRDVLGLGPAGFTRRGILRMFQLTRVFNRMCAFDNLIACGLALGMKEHAAYERAGQLLDELELTRVMYLDAGQLSGGQRKLLEFGCCFMTTPRIALLDEPFAAVHPVMRKTMSAFVRRRNEAGQTFVLVSHDMQTIVDLCPRSVCLNAGKVLAAGETKQILQSPAVIEAYLGGDTTHEAHHD
ncbi:MAG: ABC transporter ATP-binding protein [Candidimonas sp.]|nr:MAG: ABC transporter ATP-binding protein [Candidimonas sp.]